MNMGKSEKILIISYLFPPSAGIGGRRWAKIAKHWHEKGNDVAVIASYNPKDNKGPWDRDVEKLQKEGKIDYTKIYYPNILNSFEKKSLLREVEYRLALLYVKLFSKGNYYDRSIFWSSHVKRKVEKKINEGFTNIVASGAPFYFLKAIVELKKKYPDILIWIDLRDPWSWGKGYGMSAISPKRLAIEKEVESNVIQSADLITVPVSEMLNKINELHPKGNIRRVMPHFYDPDDLPNEEPIKNISRMDLIYAGTIYEGTKESIQQVADQLLCLKESGVEVLWNLYVPEPENLKLILPDSSYKDVVKINPYIPANEVLERIGKADFYISIYPKVFKDHLSTKFPELWALSTPVIYIGAEGEISRFIEDNTMGTTIAPQNISENLVEILMQENTRQKQTLTTYSLETVAKNSFSQNLM